MALIKGQNAQHATRDAVVLDLSDLARQAERLKADAQQKADRLIADAEQRAAELVEGADERGHEQGYQRGYDEGLQAGRTQGRAEALEQSAEQLQELQRVWLQALQQWETDSQWLQEQGRDGAIDLARRLAEKILHRQIAIDPTVIRDQLSHGLAQVMRPLEVSVHLHPEDRPTVEEAMPELNQQFDQVRQLHLIDDAQIQRGGCRLTYGQGGIDLTLDKQLERLTAAVLPDATQPQAGETAPASSQAETAPPEGSTTNVVPDDDTSLNPPPPASE